MKADCVLCGMGTAYPLYLSIHVSHKSLGIKCQCIWKLYHTLQGIQFRKFLTIFHRTSKKDQRFQPDHFKRDADKLLVNDAFSR